MTSPDHPASGNPLARFLPETRLDRLERESFGHGRPSYSPLVVLTGMPHEATRRIHLFVFPFDELEPSHSQRGYRDVTEQEMFERALGILSVQDIDEPDIAATIVVPPGYYGHNAYASQAQPSLDKLYEAPELRDKEFHVYAYPGNEQQFSQLVNREATNQPRVITHSLRHISPGRDYPPDTAAQLTERGRRFTQSDRSPEAQAKYWASLPDSDRQALIDAGNPLYFCGGLPWADRISATHNDVRATARDLAELMDEEPMRAIAAELAARGGTPEDLSSTIPNGLYMNDGLLIASQFAELIQDFQALHYEKQQVDDAAAWFAANSTYHPLAFRSDVGYAAILLTDTADVSNHSRVELAVEFPGREDPAPSDGLDLAADAIERLAEGEAPSNSVAREPAAKMGFVAQGTRFHEGVAFTPNDYMYIAKTLEDPALRGKHLTIHLGEGGSPAVHEDLAAMVANARLQGISVAVAAEPASRPTVRRGIIQPRRGFRPGQRGRPNDPPTAPGGASRPLRH